MSQIVVMIPEPPNFLYLLQIHTLIDFNPLVPKLNPWCDAQHTEIKGRPHKKDHDRPSATPAVWCFENHTAKWIHLMSAPKG